jgi:hypothetical protein
MQALTAHCPLGHGLHTGSAGHWASLEHWFGLQTGKFSPHCPLPSQYLTTAVSTQFGSFGAQSVQVSPHFFPPQGS